MDGDSTNPLELRSSDVVMGDELMWVLSLLAAPVVVDAGTCVDVVTLADLQARLFPRTPADPAQQPARTGELTAGSADQG